MNPDAGILVTPDSITVLEDDSLSLTASYHDSAGAVLPMPPLTWASRDTTIVRLHGSTILFVRPGSTTVVATAAGEVREVHVNAAVRFVASATGSLYPGNWCGVTTRGRVYCWGADTLTPLLLPGVPSPTQISLGDGYACAVAGDQRGFCWGQNFFGQLGTGAAASGGPFPPTEVAGGLRFTRIVASWVHSCGLTTGGEAWCWGRGNSGQLGNGAFSQQLQPVAVAGGHIFSDLALGQSFSCGLATDGMMWCWGSNRDGALGNDSVTGPATSPVRIAAGTRTFVSVAAGFAHACAVATDGTSWCWGLNTSGQLGVVSQDHCPTRDCARTPQQLPLGSLTALAAGTETTCALLTTGQASCWGYRSFGGGLSSIVPVLVQANVPLSTLAPSGSTSPTLCGSAADGAVWCWGGVFGEGQRVVNQP